MQNFFLFLLIVYSATFKAENVTESNSALVGTDAESGESSMNIISNVSTVASTQSFETSGETSLTSSLAEFEDNGTSTSSKSAGKEDADTTGKKPQASHPPLQAGPLIDLLGPAVLSLQMIDQTHAQLQPHYTSDALRNKKVIGLYFSADWCGPCRQFTPELVQFYRKIMKRRGKKDEFEIVWVSRCRDMDSFGQYFTQMGGWLALPPEDAMGKRGEMLTKKFKVKSIPTLILLDDLGHVITADARNKISSDKAGIGFPWRNPLATLYMTVFPRSLRHMVQSQIGSVKEKLLQKVNRVVTSLDRQKRIPS